jgi:hypothetical protein
LSNGGSWWHPDPEHVTWALAEGCTWTGGFRWHAVQSLSGWWCSLWHWSQSTCAALRASPSVWHVAHSRFACFAWGNVMTRFGSDVPTEKVTDRTSLKLRLGASDGW